MEQYERVFELSVTVGEGIQLWDLKLMKTTWHKQLIARLVDLLEI